MHDMSIPLPFYLAVWTESIRSIHLLILAGTWSWLGHVEVALEDPRALVPCRRRYGLRSLAKFSLGLLRSC